MAIEQLLKEYQTLIAGFIAGTTTIGAIWAAKLSVAGQLGGLKQQRSEQSSDDRRAAALLIWAEVRVIERGAREWVAKFKRRMLDETAGNAAHGSSIAVPRSTRIY